MTKTFPKKFDLKEKTYAYTCIDYRQEMQLLALRRRLYQADLDEAQKQDLIQQIQTLEAQMEMT